MFPCRCNIFSLSPSFIPLLGPGAIHAALTALVLVAFSLQSRLFVFASIRPNLSFTASLPTMPLAVPAIPEISISLASPEEPACEPFSPFTPGFSPKSPTICALKQDDDSFRPSLLSPPPTISPRALSPLRPAEFLAKGKGLQRERFEAMLKASKERNAAVGSRKEVDLRKEIALKQHKTKQGKFSSLFVHTKLF